MFFILENSSRTKYRKTSSVPSYQQIADFLLAQLLTMEIEYQLIPK